MTMPPAFKKFSLLEFSQVAESKSLYEKFGTEEIIEAFGQLELLKLRLGAYTVILALHGEDAILNAYDPFVNHLTTSAIGHHLITQTAVARKSPLLWRRFKLSIRQSGFFYAWYEHTGVAHDHDDSPEERIFKILRSPEEKLDDHLGLQVAENAKNKLPPPGSLEFEEFIRNAAKILNNRDKKEKRALPPAKQSPYKFILRHYFLSHAIWCRTTAEVISEFFPDCNADGHERHCNEINKALRLMGLSHVHTPENP